MKKRIPVLLVLALLAALLASCAQEKPQAPAEPSGQNVPLAGDPTGYPSGEVQWEFVFYGSTLYVYSDEYLTQLPEDAQEVGAVVSVDNLNLPDTEFEASRLEVGTKIYTRSTSGELIVANGEGRYERFAPYMIEPRVR